MMFSILVCVCFNVCVSLPVLSLGVVVALGGTDVGVGVKGQGHETTPTSVTSALTAGGGSRRRGGGGWWGAVGLAARTTLDHLPGPLRKSAGHTHVVFFTDTPHGE